MGWLVLTDSTLSLHACGRQFCATHKDLPLYDSIPYFTIPLRSITDVSSSTQVRGPSTGSKIAFGLLAGDRKEEFVGLVYETATSAEAPIFKTQKAQASALEAKIRFRLKKLGIVLPAPTP
jgi:hypothetical protein